MKLRRVILVLLFGSLGVTVFLELGLYLLYRFPPPVEPFLFSSQSFYREHFRRTPQFIPECFQFDPILSYRLQNAECTVSETEYRFSLRGNSLGLRDDEESLAAPSIVVLGDSQGMGWGVSEAEAYPSLLEEMQGVTVLNASLPALGTSRSLKLLKQLDRSKLSTLVFQYGDADPELNERSARTGEDSLLTAGLYYAKSHQEMGDAMGVSLPWIRNYWPHFVHTWSNSPEKELPNTRMGLYAMLERHFDDVLDKERRVAIERDKKLFELEKKSELSKKEREKEVEVIEESYVLSLSVEEWTLLDALSGRRTIKIHVHKADDVMYLLHLKQTYGLKVTAEHIGDVYEQHVFNLLAKEGVPIVYGPLGDFDYKTELYHSYYQNVELLMKSKAQYGLMTDHPVIHASALRDSLKFFLIYGMESVDAINLITQKNAEILELDHELGTIEPGKLASLLIWDRDPLHLSAKPKVVMAEGKLLRGK